MTARSNPRQGASQIGETITDMTTFEAAYHEPERVFHWYPKDPRYRISGLNPPQVGDVAWCGYVKQRPHQPDWDSLPACAACERIRRINAKS